MGDYGFRISKDGVDVKTGVDKDMVLTSKYSVLKGTKTGSGTKVVTVDAEPAVVTIPHGLGFVPMAKAYAQENGTSYYGEMPVYFLEGDGYDVLYQGSWWIEMDATNVYLKFEYLNLLGSDLPPTITMNYVYYIFNDKGNLN